MENQTFEQAVEKTVNWWAEKSFNTVINQDNGDKSSAGGMGFVFANLLSMQGKKDVTDEKVSLFKQKLKELITEPGTYYKSILSVDYHGDPPLVQACEFAGLSTLCLPIKTTTWIQTYGANPTYKVTASFGYGSAPVEI